MDLVQQKAKGKKIVAKEPEHGKAAGPIVVDLMEALKCSVKGGKAANADGEKKTARKSNKAS